MLSMTHTCCMFSRQQLKRTILLLWQEQKTCTAKAWSRYDGTTFPKSLHANTDLELPCYPLCVSTSVGEGNSGPGLVCSLHSALSLGVWCWGVWKWVCLQDSHLLVPSMVLEGHLKIFTSMWADICCVRVAQEWNSSSVVSCFWIVAIH